jgi:hypothetical protein
VSFKIILIQKSQIYVFGEGLNFVEFDNVFDFDSNLGFKIQTCRKEIVKPFYFSTQHKSHFSLAAQSGSCFQFPTSPAIFGLFGPISVQYRTMSGHLPPVLPSSRRLSSCRHRASGATPGSREDDLKCRRFLPMARFAPPPLRFGAVTGSPRRRSHPGT